MKPPVFDVQDAIRSCTLTVRIETTRTTRLRLFVGAKLLYLAGWIIGFDATYVDLQ